MSFVQNMIGLQNRDVVNGVTGHWEVIYDAPAHDVIEEFANPQYADE